MHRWYGLYKGIIGSFIGGINEIHDFFISIVFSFPSGDISGDMVNFLKKLKLKFLFQIKKMKISNFFISSFRDIFQFFKFQSKFQNQFFSIFPIHYGQFFFQNSKTKVFNSNFKIDFFQKISFEIFLMI
jgi:hypothetical protein